MDPTGAGRSVSIGAIVAAVGGGLAVLGAFLEVASVDLALAASNNVTLSANYFDTDDGKIVAAVGLIVLLVGLATLVGWISGVVPAIVFAAGGLALFGFALNDRLDFDSALGRLTFGPALYVVMAGGLVAAIGGVLASRET